MLVLLPSSEGKTPADDGAPVDLAALTSPGLTEQRERVLDALVAGSARDDAAALLGLGAGRTGELTRNVGLRTEPAAPAERVYTGVLYAAAGLDGLTGTARRRARESVRVVSALWGLVAPGDRIPAYRLPMGADLPGIGRLATAWREPLAEELDPRAARELVVDCRSAAYTAAWRPSREHVDRWVAVRVLREQAGRRSVVSHMAKHTRGVLTHHLLTRSGPPPTSVEALLGAAQELVGAPASAGGAVIGAELDRPRPRGPWQLDVVTS